MRLRPVLQQDILGFHRRLCLFRRHIIPQRHTALPHCRTLLPGGHGSVTQRHVFSLQSAGITDSQRQKRYFNSRRFHDVMFPLFNIHNEAAG